MTNEDVFQKYWQAPLTVSGDVTEVSDATVALALRLAVQDAYNAGAEVYSDMADSASLNQALQNALDQVDRLREERNVQPDQRYHEYLQAQISRLNEWLAEKAPAFYRETTDTATAVLAAIDALQGVVAEYREQLAQMDADNAGLLRQVRELEAWKTVAIECNGQAATLSSSPIVASTDFGAPGAGVTLPAPVASPPIAAAPAPDGATARTSASSVSTNGPRGPGAPGPLGRLVEQPGRGEQ